MTPSSESTDVLIDPCCNSVSDQGSSVIDSDPSTLEETGSTSDYETVGDILGKIRIKNVNRIVIGTLNINSLAPKFAQLREIIGKTIDILS